MSCRVKEDTKSLTTGLVFGERGAEAEEMFLGLLQVIAAEVQVEPARCGGVGPWGWLGVGDALKIETDVAVAGEHDEVLLDDSSCPPRNA